MLSVHRLTAGGARTRPVKRGWPGGKATLESVFCCELFQEPDGFLVLPVVGGSRFLVGGEATAQRVGEFSSELGQRTVGAISTPSGPTHQLQTVAWIRFVNFLL